MLSTSDHPLFGSRQIQLVQFHNFHRLNVCIRLPLRLFVREEYRLCEVELGQLCWPLLAYAWNAVLASKSVDYTFGMDRDPSHGSSLTNGGRG